MDSKPAPDPKEEVLGVDVSVSVWEAERETEHFKYSCFLPGM